MNGRIKELCNQAGFFGENMYPIVGTTQEDALKNLVDLVVKQCGFYADVFSAIGCTCDMDPNETKPSDFINTKFGIKNV